MKYIGAFLLLILNLYNYQIHLNPFLFLGLSLIIIAFTMYAIRKNNNFILSIVEMLIFAWPISWMNIFGRPTEYLQLPWFYLFGALIVFYTILNIKELYSKQQNGLLMVVFIVFFIYSLVPLLKSVSFSEGLKEYIMIMFFMVLFLCMYLKRDTIDNSDREKIINDIIFINLLCSIFIIVQYVMFTYFNISLFKIGNSLSYGGIQTSCGLLLEDTSCSTIMIGCGGFYAYLKGKEKKINYLYAFIIMMGLAFTSRRTSVICLIVILVIYTIFSDIDIFKKILYTILAPIFGFVMIHFLQMSRPVENISQLVENNGRIPDYISGIQVFLKHPLGIGYDNIYLASLMTRGIIPHNTILRWLDMGGIVLALCLAIMIVYTLYKAYTKGLKDDFWVLLYVFGASNLIPDILNARFFIILCSVVLLCIGNNDQSNRETINNRIINDKEV